MPQKINFHPRNYPLYSQHRVLALIIFLCLSIQPVNAHSVQVPQIAKPQPNQGSNSANDERAKTAKFTYNLGLQLFQQDNTELLKLAIEKFQEALKLFHILKDRPQEALSLLALGRSADLLEQKQNALIYYNQALPIYKEVGDRNGEAITLNNIGKVYSDLGDKQKALSYYNQALPISKEVGDDRVKALTLNNIGEVYDNLGDKQKALIHYTQALPLTKEAGDRKREVDTINAIGGVYLDLGNNEKALSYYNQALPIYREIGDRRNEASTLNDIGVVYSHLSNKQNALIYYNQALPIYKEVGDRNGEAITLNNIGKVYSDLGDKQKALSYYNQALPISKEVGDQKSEASILDNIGGIYLELGKNEKALSHYNQALLIFIRVGDRSGEAIALRDIGTLYSALDDNQKALSYFNQALPIHRKIGDRMNEAITVTSIGVAYSGLGDQQKALTHYNQALPISKEIGDRSSEADILNNIGKIYSDLGDKQKALSYYNQALPIRKEVIDRSGEATTLNNIGFVYSNLGDQEKALTYFNQALPIRKEISDHRGEATTLNNIGQVYSDLGDNQKALDYFNQALPIYKEVDGRSGEATTLNNIGQVYSNLGDNQKALTYYNQALLIFKELGDRSSEATMLNNIGQVYSDLGDNQKALDYFNQALPIYKEVDGRSGEATTLNNIGQVYSNLGDNQKALTYYNQALLIFKEFGNRKYEATVLSNLMVVYEDLQQPRLATLFGKQAVNVYQSLRADIGGLDRLTQQTFLNSIQNTYRKLFDILVAQGRLPEAEFVINLLKQDEYFEYVRRDQNEAKPDSRVALSPDEERFVKRYNEISDGITSIGKQRGELRLKAKNTSLTAQETQLLSLLNEDLKAANFQFQKFLNQMAQELSKNNQTDYVKTIKDSQSLMGALKEIGNNTIAIYTVVSDDKYTAFIVTPDVQVARPISIKAADLNRKVAEFRAVLQNPRSNPLPLAQELYNILIAPIIKDLEGAKAETLMWSLDGTLRYLPIAALHDGKQYIVEKYRNVIFTPASNVNLKDKPSSSWKGLGFGVSKGSSEFSPLPAVPDELRGIIHDTTSRQTGGILEGRILLDEAFTAESMKGALLQQYPLVHIASHFRFQPGDETKSYLLLGQGVMTIAEIKLLGNFFEGVDLLTLSACNTAMGGAGAQGKEFEGFAVDAQRQGAKAVMATLWSVADDSTRLLMQEFYRNRERQKGMTKAAALRQAQLALLKGTATSDKSSGNVISTQNARKENRSGEQTFVKDAKAPFAHPYYWAPFILIGNSK